MRKIIFRGKQIHGGQWLYGYYFAYECLGDGYIYHSIVPEKYSSKPSEHFHVLPETIGEFTGLTDKNGREIYEGDIVTDEISQFQIIWNNSQFDFARTSGAYQYPYFPSNADRMEIIGNIHDNPELLTPKQIKTKNHGKKETQHQ